MNKLEISKRVEYVKTKLKKLEISLKKYENKNIDEDDKYIALKAIEKDCEEIIESATRINQEILSELGEIGNTYRESFEKLEKLKLFESKDFVEKLCNTIEFRAKLMYDSINVDTEITIISAKNILKIYPKYLLKILEYVEKK